MRNFPTYLSITLLELALCIVSVRGQSFYDREGRIFQYGARAGAFAGAYVSESYDVSSMYWNPASISHVQRSAVVGNYSAQWSGQGQTELIAVPISGGYWTAFAVGVHSSQLVLQRKATNFPELTGKEYGIDCAISFKIAPTFSAGIIGMFKHYQLRTHQERSVVGALGLLYAPSPEISYGMSYSGFGETADYTSVNSIIGLSRMKPPKVLQFGLTMRFPSSRSDRIISIILANDKIFGQSGIRYSGAMEVSVTNYMDLRSGYVVSPQYAGAKYGIGLRTGGFHFDYAISPNAQTNRFHEFTAAIPI